MLALYHSYLTEYGVPLEKVQEMVEWLKVHKYPISEVENYMKETAFYRGKWIRNNGSKSIAEVLKEFPRLVDNPGMVRIIFVDFYYYFINYFGFIEEIWEVGIQVIFILVI